MTIRAATSAEQGTAAESIRQALAAARAGRLEEACALAEGALAAGGDPVPINALLGMVRLDLGETERAVEHLEFAHQQRPSDIRIATDLATALAALERFDRALEVASAELARADPTFQLARLRGAVAVQLRDVAAATEILQHVVGAMPTDWESWNNLGNALSVSEDFEQSAAAFERALAINPRSPEVRMNYANALRELRRTDEAAALFRDVASEFPDNPLPLRELHLLLKDFSFGDAALEAIDQAIDRAPNNVELLLLRANHFGTLHKMHEAETAYLHILEIDPAEQFAYLGLAMVYELSNRTGDLAALQRQVEERGIGEPVLNFIRAYSLGRAKKFAEGIAALEKVPEEMESPRRMHLLAQLLEGAGRYDEAFEAFSRMNEIMSDDASQPEERAEGYRDAIRKFSDTVTKDWVRAWRAETDSDPGPAPVFLVGFPRSGTTLLDTILMGHPQIEVMEEEPALREALQLLPSFAGLPGVSDDEIKAARDVYFKTAVSLTPLAPGKLLVDKNPLTMNLLPFVRRLFPEARIILALRHPCDVVLSCFKANFRLNEAMSNFLRLDTAAELYDLSFSYYEQIQHLMAFPTHTVVYENVVADRESELRKLFDFLGLDWHDAVLEHQETARKRGRIKTASYSQVVEPIYTRASGRWLKYRKHLEPVLPVLEPWIRKFGYSTNA